MTELVRELLRAMKGKSVPDSDPVAELPPAKALLPIELRVPAGRQNWGIVERLIEDLLSQRMTMLDVQIDPDVRVQPGAGSTVDLAIGGRPVAVGIDPGLHANPDKLVSEIDQRLRRRLSLLLGDSPDPVSAYVVDHGFAVQPVSPSTPPGLDSRIAAAPEVSAEELGERVLATCTPQLKLEVAAKTLSNAERTPEAVSSLRRALFERKGILFPDLGLEPTSGRPGTVWLTANDIRVGPFDVGEDAGWNDVVDKALRPFLLHQAAWFVWNLDIKRAFEELEFTLPDLGATFLECYPRQYMLTACVRNFVREGRPVRNLPRILWLLLEIGGAGIGSEKVSFSENPLLRDPSTPPNAQRDPSIVAARVRKCLAEESWRMGVQIMKNPVRIPAQVESVLVDASGPEALAAAEWAAVEAAAGYAADTTVVTSSVQAIAPLHKALRALPHRLKVIAAQELPPDQVVGF
ncbi:hypothetical protein OG394_04955 [Kribbella sp. NBC_01245]|uniref:hypothetical protein n=1 Tax=Kribbella sp. NBC_01245 TaxID=2903578 RepID=UPI002E2B9D56|nr:hypothetical protein [Kribbella sp. NBC_01245]